MLNSNTKHITEEIQDIILSSAPLQAHIQGTSQYGAEMNMKNEVFSLRGGN